MTGVLVFLHRQTVFQEGTLPSLDDNSSRLEIFLLIRRIVSVVTLGCKHSLNSEIKMLM